MRKKQLPMCGTVKTAPHTTPRKDKPSHQTFGKPLFGQKKAHFKGGRMFVIHGVRLNQTFFCKPP